jgi:hypothetical protein
MQRLCRLLDKQEVVLDTSPLNKGRLILVDQLRHLRRKPARHDLGEQARETVDEADRPEVREVDSSGLLGEKRNERVIQALETLIPAKPDRAQRQDHVALDHRPTAAVELPGKAVGPWGLVGWHRAQCGPNLVVRKLHLQSRKIDRLQSHGAQVQVEFPTNPHQNSSTKQGLMGL